MKRKTFAFGLAAAALLPAALPAHAQDAAPVRIVIGFPPGGAVDSLARTLAEKLRTSLNTTVLVENRPGANTFLAMDTVKKAAPDGRTVLINFSPAFTIYPFTFSKLPYDPQKDFVPVTQLVRFPLALSAGANQPYRNFDDYRRWVKAAPGRGSVGMPGAGTSAHFAVLEMGKALGAEVTPVPYKGGAAVLADEMGGHIGAGIDSIGSKLELYRGGKIRLLAVTGAKRTPLAPDVPTFDELGVKGLDYPSGWYGAFTTGGTPPDVVQKLSRALNEALQDPAARKQLENFGLEVAGSTPAELKATIESDSRFWQPVIKAAGFKAD
ncbi:tripartite tricarboxylate transporter substrate binding protein [Ramlibacter henchirensis]|uniref:Tripartite tricarboxylate transporter substrate binding protein n=1 Tax=Ramlibacter henchirensis TaxID=204072 RepID=A0A4Z0BVW1_9BURK|nr:Bug family tripartite tricarboxylate transporter substrate binding protein [Ramlibacter henchirensis]TFZ02614.1 tripartite tricarboxylate transporter substrate binding protein [Ramlibacter henchirensis]